MCVCVWQDVTVPQFNPSSSPSASLQDDDHISLRFLWFSSFLIKIIVTS